MSMVHLEMQEIIASYSRLVNKAVSPQLSLKNQTPVKRAEEALVCNENNVTLQSEVSAGTVLLHVMSVPRVFYTA